MAKLYYDKDIDQAALRGSVVAILGYGSQGHAHALNLKDSGFDVLVGLYEGSKSKEKAEADGLEVLPNAEAVKRADVTMICLPDTVQPEVYKNEIAPNLDDGNMLMFAHGFNIHYGTVQPAENIDVTMIAPKAPGHRFQTVVVEAHSVDHGPVAGQAEQPGPGISGLRPGGDAARLDEAEAKSQGLVRDLGVLVEAGGQADRIWEVPVPQAEAEIVVLEAPERGDQAPLQGPDGQAVGCLGLQEPDQWADQAVGQGVPLPSQAPPPGTMPPGKT